MGTLMSHTNRVMYESYHGREESHDDSAENESRVHNHGSYLMTNKGKRGSI